MFQRDTGHVDGTLVVRDHHGGEVMVGVAGVRCRHGDVHAAHGRLHQTLKAVGGGAGIRRSSTRGKGKQQ